MTQASAVIRTVAFRARGGHGHGPAERPRQAAALVAEAPGNGIVSDRTAS
jgi:hypothetical protein